VGEATAPALDTVVGDRAGRRPDTTSRPTTFHDPPHLFTTAPESTVERWRRCLSREMAFPAW